MEIRRTVRTWPVLVVLAALWAVADLAARTATWTTPRTWTTGEIVTASMLNGHVRDNLEYLKAQVDALSAGSGAPAGQVAFYELAACPAGWSELTSARGRYLVGLPSGGTLSATVGTALTNTENRAVGQHGHTATSTVTDPGHTHTAAADAGSAQAPTGTGRATVTSGTTGSSTTGVTVGTTVADAGSVAGTNAPYLQLLACKKD